MTIDPGGQSTVSQIVTHLYDEIRDMRTDIAGARSDLRDMAATMRAGLSQVGDHETRIREVERAIAPMAALEERDKKRDEDMETRMRTVERTAWRAAGVAAGVSAVVGGSVGVVVTLLTTGR